MNLVFHFLNARKVEDFAPHTTIFREGEPGRSMYVLLEGAAKIMVGKRVVELAGPGSIFGEMALIDDKPRSATVLTRSQCLAVSIGRKEFDLLVREQPEFARHVMKVLVDRLRRMDEALEPAIPAEQAPARQAKKKPAWRSHTRS
ncbi:MAG TPA: cyclic nucleotide-binding domain-containing protein [Burkholderiales bacterium]